MHTPMHVETHACMHGPHAHARLFRRAGDDVGLRLRLGEEGEVADGGDDDEPPHRHRDWAGRHRPPLVQDPARLRPRRLPPHLLLFISYHLSLFLKISLSLSTYVVHANACNTR